jgi:hypothetical protein
MHDDTLSKLVQPTKLFVMRQLLYLVMLASLLPVTAFSQYIHKIKADSVLITNDSCTAELNLENSTKNVTGGFLYNKGKGRTEFRKPLTKINDTLYLVGDDSLNLSAGTKNIYNSDGVLTDQRIIHGNMQGMLFDSLNSFAIHVVGNVAYYPTINEMFFDTDAGIQMHRGIIFGESAYRISSLGLGENSTTLQTSNQYDSTSALGTTMTGIFFMPFEGNMIISELARASDAADKAIMVWDSTTGAWQRTTPAVLGLARVLTASSALNFPSTSAGSNSDLTIIVTGAADGDAVSLGVPNASINSNSSFSAWVNASNTVTVRFNNYSSGSIDPANGTFKVTVLK